MEAKACSAKENLILIPKCEKYVEYMINVLIKLPRTEKFNIGNEFKICMYQMFENILFLSKMPKSMRLTIYNKIDALIAIQRCYIRIIYKSSYIDEKKYKVSICMLDEIGKILGGYIKSLGIRYETDR